MKNNIQIFQNEQFGQVRTIVEGDKVLFCGADVAKALGYGRPNEAVARHAKGTLKQRILTNGGEQEMLFITEGDVYRLIVRSKLPAAERFESWVFDEVLPTIRKTGSYMMPRPDSYMIDDPIERAKRWIEEEQDRQALRSANQELTTKNKLLAGDSLIWADRPFINAVVRAYATQACDGDFAQAWVNVKKELLYKYGINLNSRITAYMNKTGKRTKPKTLDMLDDSEIPNVVSTVVALCDVNNVNIHDLVGKFCQEIAC